MPSASDELRDKFFTRNLDGHIVDDGIDKAEKIIESYGGSVSKQGLITYPPSFDTLPEDVRIEISEAVDWLCDEWDYATEL